MPDPLPLLLPYDISNPKHHFTMLLTSMPMPGGVRVPIPQPTKTIPLWSEEGWRLGYRHHPELQELYPIPGDQPGMGWLNTPRMVGREEYAQWLSTSTDKAKDVLTTVFGKEHANKIDQMSPEEKDFALRQAKVKVFEAVAKMQELSDKIDDIVENGNDRP